MIASYILSSTFVPVMSVWLLRQHVHATGHKKQSLFERFTALYGKLIGLLVRLRWIVLPGYLAALRR